MPEREKYERLTEVEDELEREKIDLMLTVHIPASFGQVSKKALLSLHGFPQLFGGRLERPGDIACHPSIVQHELRQRKIRMSH